MPQRDIRDGYLYYSGGVTFFMAVEKYFTGTNDGQKFETYATKDGELGFWVNDMVAVNLDLETAREFLKEIKEIIAFLESENEKTNG